MKDVDIQVLKIQNLINETEKYIEDQNTNYYIIFDLYQKLLDKLIYLKIPTMDTYTVSETELIKVEDEKKSFNGYDFYGAILTSLNSLNLTIEECCSGQEEIKFEAHFNQIEKIIIDHFKNAKFIIWVAVAWISSPGIVHTLKEKHKEGLNIQVIMSSEDESRSNLETFSNLEKERIAICMTEKWGFGEKKYNRMHNKFAIIDLKTVISGSFNYTSTANFNKENIFIIQKPDLVEQYVQEFIRIKKMKRRI